MIQSIPINCVNRDDLGNIKTAVFGGAVRQRISSQCWKRQVREELEKTTDLSWRSVKIPQKLYNALTNEKNMSAQKALEKVGEIFTSTNGKAKKVRVSIKGSKKKWEEILKDGLNKDDILVTNTLYFLSKTEFKDLVEICLKEDKKNINKILSDSKDRYGASIALFGRMMADHTDLDVPAASSFSHAITTHEIAQESDYFTAMDDLNTESGAGHLNQTSFSSGTFYRHIALDIDTLKENLEGDLSELSGKFIEACIKAFPAGKKNSFLSNTLPAKIIIDITPLPISMANAFEEPIVSNNGFIEKSIEALNKHRSHLITEGYTVDNSLETISIEEASNFVKGVFIPKEN
jgi:CRISPR system Cascade subunit CasC